MPESDESLVERARRGDRAAFDSLVTRYQGAMYHLALRFCGHPEEARELAQDILVRVYLKLGTFGSGRTFRPWLYKVAASVCLSAAERRRVPTRSLEPVGEEPALDPPGDPREDPARQTEARALASAVQAAVLELPAPYRAVMLLRHVEGLELTAIAEALELPLGTVKTHLHRARNRLRERLGDLLPDHLGESR